VRALFALRAVRGAHRAAGGDVRMSIDAGDASGRMVFEAEHVSKAFAGVTVVRDFTQRILRGDRIGLIGPNGAGKTTLLRLLTGELEPDSGTVRRGARVQIAYFDQRRAELDPERSVADSVNDGNDTVVIGGQPRHVLGYLADFLFPRERAVSPVTSLSGGERNRLMLARLFARPANVLVLDEPTNDLDIETLELLEALLADYAGTAFLVSHDRRFVDNVVTSIVAWEGDPEFGGKPGLWREYEGGITDWLTQRERSRVVPAVAAPVAAPPSAPEKKASTKLSYKEQRELEALPARIETLEAEQRSITELTADPDLYTRDPQRAAALHERSAQIEDELMAALERWEALGSR
jgi:ATP-binding cassette subfamily F protein uup